MYTLMIGNGFDLAHNLPTKYVDFMNFLEWCYLTENGYDKYIEVAFQKLDAKLRNYIENNFRNEDIIISNIKNLVNNQENNKWYEYFTKILNEGEKSRRELGRF